MKKLMVQTDTKKGQICVRIPENLNKRLEEHVRQIGISKPAFILGLIYAELEKNKSSERKEK